jgi:hypothetical protein
MAISNCNNCEYHAAETCSQNPDYAQAFQSLGNLPEQAQTWVGARLESCPHWQLSYDEELLTAPVQLPRRIWRILAAQTNGLTPLALVAQDLLADRMIAETAEVAEVAEAAIGAESAQLDEPSPSAIAPNDLAETATASELEDLELIESVGDLDQAENLTAAEALEDLAEDLKNSAAAEDLENLADPLTVVDEAGSLAEGEDQALTDVEAAIAPTPTEQDSITGFFEPSTPEPQVPEFQPSQPQTFEGTPVTAGQQMSEADLEVAIASFLHGIADGESMTALEETRADSSRGSGRISSQQGASAISLPDFRHWPGL